MSEASVRLAFAGERGAFAEDAAMAFLPGCLAEPVPTFRDVFEAVDSGAAGGGVVPIENIIQGTVREVYDLLLEHDLAIVGEIELPVTLCLAALPGQRLEDVTRVYSHVHALAQAEPYLRGRPWALVASTTTSGAGAQIAARAEKSVAAVLSPRAARLHGLEVLADGIQSDPHNRTRFLALAARASPAWAASENHRARRSTIAFAVANQPGALLRVLDVIAAHGINISKLESRPNGEREWEYVFWADLDGDLCRPEITPVVSALSSVTISLRVFGCYPQRSTPAQRRLE